MRGLRDRVLLVGTAFLVCLTTGASFLLGEIYHVNPAWLFFAWNSILLLPILWKELRVYFGRPAFIIFSIGWMCAHGATVLGLMLWVPVILWPLILLLELAAGFIAAHWLFGFPLRPKPQE
jgi:hypothetical protein